MWSIWIDLKARLCVKSEVEAFHLSECTIGSASRSSGSCLITTINPWIALNCHLSLSDLGCGSSSLSCRIGFINTNPMAKGRCYATSGYKKKRKVPSGKKWALHRILKNNSKTSQCKLNSCTPEIPFRAQCPAEPRCKWTSTRKQNTY